MARYNDNAYRELVGPKEARCKRLEGNAREIRYQNNDVPSKEEFHFLTEAAKIRKELMNLSTGEAYEEQKDMLNKLNKRKEEIAQYLDPKGYEELMKKYGNASDNKTTENGGNVQNNSASANNSSPKTNDGISDETVKSWFPQEIPEHGFADVAGMKNLIERLSNCALGVQWNEVKKYLKMPTVHTYFFYGLPGCGKTFIANAFAHELIVKEKYNYMALTGGKIMSSKVGVAEKTIERVFEEAKKHAPCILFIDEIDGVCADRNDDSTPQYARSLTTAFLTGYNSLKDFKEKIIFIAATNYPELVDSAMLDRAELIYVEIPDQEARCHAFQLKFQDIVKLEDGFSYMEMAKCTEGYNYRDLDRLEEHLKDKIFTGVRSEYTSEVQALCALKNGEYPLTRELFEEAFAAYEPASKEREKEAMKKWREKVTRII